MKIKKIILVGLVLFLGGFMVYGGICKFLAPKIDALELVSKSNALLEAGKITTLKKVLYISGMKQTGYFWELLGVCELVFGLLLFIPATRLVGVLLLFPITLHILLFHVFLDFHEAGELALTSGLFMANVLLVRWGNLLKLLVGEEVKSKQLTF